MASEVLKVTGTKSGANVTSTISDINPAATNAQLAQMATKFNALTSNTYKESNRITTVNVDTEPGGGTKPTPTITLNPTTISIADVPELTSMNWANFTATTTSDGELYVRYEADASQILYAIGTSQNGFVFRKGSSTTPATNIIVGVTETDSYKGVEVAFEITA